MKKFLQEFKAFISKGNVVDLAVAVIIGGAFGKIVTSLVNDMIMPLVVMAMGKHSLAELTWVLRDAVVVNGEITRATLTIKWGSFLQTIIDFLVIAFVVFVFVKILMSVKNAGDKLSKETRAMLKKARKDLKKGIVAVETNHAEAQTEQKDGEHTDESAHSSDNPKEEAQSQVSEPPKDNTELLSGIEELLRDIRDSLANKTN